MIGQEFFISLGSYSTRFSEAALARIKGECASITSDRSTGLTDSRLPPVLVEVSQHLENLVKKIEFDRNVVQKLRPQACGTPAGCHAGGGYGYGIERALEKIRPVFV